jgi:hypothetical protein
MQIHLGNRHIIYCMVRYHCDAPVVVQIVRTFDFTFYWFCLLGLWPSNLYYIFVWNAWHCQTVADHSVT